MSRTIKDNTMRKLKYPVDEKRTAEERQAAYVRCWLGRYYCYCYAMENNGTYFYSSIGFATDKEYSEFVEAWQGQGFIGTVYHNNCPTDRFEPVITYPQCGQHIEKPVGLVPGKEVFCPSCQEFFVYN